MKPEGFSNYTEAKVLCDAAIKGGDSAGIVKHTDVSNVPDEILSPLKNGCDRLLAKVGEMDLIRCHELDRSEYEKYKKDEFAKLTPNFQELEKMAPELKWNIEPEKYLIYHFEAKDNPASKLKITFGLFEKSGKWWFACSY